MRNFFVTRKKTISLCRILVFFVFGSLFSLTGLVAQTYFFDSYGVFDGLPHSKVYDVMEDDRGYVWLATAAGVSVFDGMSFRNYSAADGLAPNEARTIHQDKKGKIWVGHNHGRLSVFNGKEFETPELGGTVIQRDITSFLETEKGEIWITSEGNGIVRISNPYDSPSQFIYEQYSGGTISPVIFNSLLGNDGTLYFITNMGISVYDEEGNIFKPFRPEKLPRYFFIIYMFEDSSDNLWFGTHNGGLYKYDPDDEQLTIYDYRDGLAHNWISYITEDSRGNMWIGTWGGGLTRISGTILKSFDTANGLSDNFIRSITEDAEGNILIATNENGLAIYKGEQLFSYQVSDGLPHPLVWSIYQDSRGQYWFGTQRGVSLYDPALPEDEAFRNIFGFNGFSLERVRFIKEDLNGNIWISTDVSGVGMYNRATGSFTDMTDELIDMGFLPRNSPSPTAVEIDNHNNLWLGTNFGISWINIDNGEGGTFTQGAGIAGNDISSLFYDSQGVMWVGSSGSGLATISEKMEVKPVELEEEFTPLCMTEDIEGNIWIGTESQGVIVYDGDSVVMNLLEKDGLLGNYISLIIADKNNNIYIGTSRGLNRYNKDEDRIYTYTRRNGFTGIDAKDKASFLDRDGKLWFGTVEGVMVFDPSVSVDELPEPPAHLTGLRVNYIERELRDGLQLNYRDNSVIFDYNSISLTNPDAVRFRVILEGADPDWRPETRETTAIYPGLSPGRYVFRVMASNSQNIWNTSPVTYSFRIRPPWYQSWWGITIFIISGIIAILAYIKIRERNLIREKRILENKVAERTREISEKNELLAQKNKDITDSINYAKRLQDAILPAEDTISGSFVFFRPKDIVSGDFYWIISDNGFDLMAAVDCTGHGVPGAFMSLIGHNGLNKIVKEMKITRPGSILDKLNEEVYKTLHQNIGLGEDVKDGMDMSIIAYHGKKKILEYAGAYNSLYHIRNGELTEYKADKVAIGHSFENMQYSNHKIDIETGDTIYIFSDGFADQFGGDKGKKFMTKNLKNLLLDINDRAMADQKAILEKTLLEWMGDNAQLDDILIIGRRF